VLRSNVDTSSPEYKENKASMEEVLARMRELRTKVEEGGTKKAKDKHVARGKMLAREYVYTILPTDIRSWG
jgi:3-methylcrotonyl-CoA carboxylase beta subunit